MAEIEGIEILERKLDRLARMSGREMAAALESGAQVLVNETKRLAPYLTGNLRRSYHAERHRVTQSKASVVYGTDVEYAPYQEYGTRYMSGKPHVRPAIETKKDEAAREIAEAMEQLIEQKAG